MNTPRSLYLCDTLALINGVYGLNNALSGISLRTIYGHMQDLVISVICNQLRNGVSKGYLAGSLSNLFAWWCTAVTREPILDLQSCVQGHFQRKYLGDTCLRCHKPVCDCDVSDRSDYYETGESAEGIDTHTAFAAMPTIHDCQVALEKKYKAANIAQGVIWVAMRIAQEIGEAHELLTLGMVRSKSSLERRDEMAAELADVLAWIFALASLLEIDLQEVFQKQYANGCPHCSLSPCGCTTLVLNAYPGSVPVS